MSDEPLISDTLWTSISAKPAAPAPAPEMPVQQAQAPATIAAVQPEPPQQPTARNEADARQEVIRQLRGPVAQTFKRLMPELANAADPYRAILGNAHTLDRAIRIFESRRDAFAQFLVSEMGQPVSDDAMPLFCGRSVNDVTAMAVRSGMRAYAEQHFTGTKRVVLEGETATEAKRNKWVGAIAVMFRQRHGYDARKSATAVERFYNAIKDHLNYGWQVPFFPIYCEIPADMFEKMGAAIARLDDLDKLRRLAQMNNQDVTKAQDVMRDPLLAQEMMANNALASRSISQMTGPEFKTVSEGLANIDPKKKWDIFANTLTALQLGKDRRISQADIAALAQHLDILNEYAVRIIFELKLGREQFANFLETAAKALGKRLFMALFGPIPFFGLDDAAARVRKTYVGFVETTLKGLVGAVQKLAAKFSHSAPELVSECLALVCEARKGSIEIELDKLAPLIVTS